MRKVITGFVATAIALASIQAFAFGCGFKPFPPLGCRSDQARCYCDQYGRCTWIWEC